MGSRSLLSVLLAAVLAASVALTVGEATTAVAEIPAVATEVPTAVTEVPAEITAPIAIPAGPGIPIDAPSPAADDETRYIVTFVPGVTTSALELRTVGSDGASPGRSVPGPESVLAGLEIHHLADLSATATIGTSKLANGGNLSTSSSVDLGLSTTWALVTGPDHVLETLAEQPEVLAVEPDHPITNGRSTIPVASVVGDQTTPSAAAPVAPAAVNQIAPTWGLDRIDQRFLPLSGSYRVSSTGASVRAYVIDDGIYRPHPEFGGRAVPGAFLTSRFDSDGDPVCSPHGTHVAGTIGGTQSGVAKEVELFSIRIMDCQGGGATSDLILALDWIIANHTSSRRAVVNLSLGGPGSLSLDQATRRVVAAGFPVIAAAGNEGQNACNSSPAREPQAITVAATGRIDFRPSWSNSGTCVDLFAPGESIQSAGLPWGLTNMDGTSMAAPHVAGAAALLLSTSPSLTPAQVAQQLINNATPGVVLNPGTGSPNRLLFVGDDHADPPSGLPANDRFANAATLDLSVAQVRGSNVGASNEPGEPRHAFVPGGASVWWRFTAPTSGRIELDTVGSDFDTVLAAYTGSRVDALTPIAWNDDHGGRLTSAIGFDTVAGTTYSIAVDGFGGDSGQITLNVDWSPGTSPIGPYPTERLAGADRFATAAALSARRFSPGVPIAYLATGSSFADGLAAGAIAGGAGPVLLVRHDLIPGATAAELARLQPGRIVVLGGHAVVGSQVFESANSFTAGPVVRVGGFDRYSTAAALSAHTMEPGVHTVFVATGLSFADALSAGSIAGGRSPVLLTRPDVLPADTVRELQRLRPTRIVVLGGMSAVSASVEHELRRYAGETVERWAGADRYATSVAISQRGYSPGVRTVFIATGAAFADALAAGPVAAGAGPVLLSRSECVPWVVLDEIERLDPSEVVIVGGSTALGHGVFSLLPC